MNVDSSACASSATAEHWDQVNWKQCERQVARLQARIVKASREGRWSKVKSLQRLLTCSFSGKALAVKRVTENKGKRTSGVDHVLWSTPQSKLKAIASLQRRGYRPLPLRRVHIPKSNGKLRPLSIPVMKDRAMQALYLMALEPVTETYADPNSYGFRKGRSTADAIEQCFKFLSKSDAPEWILEGDIKGCFDRRRAVMEMFSDNAKTYIQLSGAALTLTLTFAKAILHIPDTQSIVNRYTVAMWSCFLLAILLGAFYQFLAVKQLDAFLDWDYDETWDWAQPGWIYAAMLAAFYGGSVIFTIYAIVQLQK
jgi:hypothetical protein